MAETIAFDCKGGSAQGALSLPDGGSGPGVVVIQEWWGVDDNMRGVADRMARAGFVALVPDLYHGEVAGHDEMDKAGELMERMPPDRAARDMSGAVDCLADHDAVTGAHLGVIGFCMGGMLSFLLAAQRPDRIGAIVPFYGFPQGEMEPDWSLLTAAIRGHMAEHDDFFPPDAAKALEAKLRDLGKDVEFIVHPGSGHAFMATHNALGTYDEKLAEQLWPEITAFLHERLG